MKNTVSQQNTNKHDRAEHYRVFSLFRLLTETMYSTEEQVAFCAHLMTSAYYSTTGTNMEKFTAAFESEDMNFTNVYHSYKRGGENEQSTVWIFALSAIFYKYEEDCIKNNESLIV